uniref:Uncharacterized protein n=1 Tax=Schistosoma haematobium TaxID=6185 RepID=A0A094ZJJ9_SCHHA
MRSSARAYNQGASLQLLLRYAPDRNEVLSKKLKDVIIINETTFPNLYPVNGFLLLSLCSIQKTSSRVY